MVFLLPSVSCFSLLLECIALKVAVLRLGKDKQQCHHVARVHQGYLLHGEGWPKLDLASRIFHTRM